MDNISLLCYKIIKSGVEHNEAFINLKKAEDGLKVLDYFFNDLDETLKIHPLDAERVINCFKSLCNEKGYFDVSLKGDTYMITPERITNDKDVDVIIAIWKC